MFLFRNLSRVTLFPVVIFSILFYLAFSSISMNRCRAHINEEAEVERIEKANFMRATENKVVVAQEELFRHFTDFIFRKYCQSHFEDWLDSVKYISKINPWATSREVIEFQYQTIDQFIEGCNNKHEIHSYIDRFGEITNVSNVELLKKISAFIYADTNMSLVSKQILVEEILKKEIEENFTASKIYDKINGQQNLIPVINEDLNVERLLKDIEQESGQTKSKRSVRSKRCPVCNKKMGIIPFDCRCGRQFCVSHVLPESHQCKFDFKEEGKKKITNQNPKVIGQKVAPIP